MTRPKSGAGRMVASPKSVTAVSGCFNGSSGTHAISLSISRLFLPLGTMVKKAGSVSRRA